ncbi:hypothetical protein MGAST_11685 [Mycobacterium gastri 'Wayne']|nr:hypothetical protein MGAST_11685 [Mycobacterium gastri 'Wayne']
MPKAIASAGAEAAHPAPFQALLNLIDATARAL